MVISTISVIEDQNFQIFKKKIRNSLKKRTYGFVEFNLRTWCFGDIFGEILQKQKPESLIENFLEFYFTRLLQIFQHNTSHTEKNHSTLHIFLSLSQKKIINSLHSIFSSDYFFQRA